MMDGRATDRRPVMTVLYAYRVRVYKKERIMV